MKSSLPSPPEQQQPPVKRVKYSRAVTSSPSIPPDRLSELIVVHCELSDELLTFLDSEAIATLCSVLRFNKHTCAVLEDERRWQLLLKMRCGIGGVGEGIDSTGSDAAAEPQGEEHQPIVVTPTVLSFGCRALVEFLSLRSQLQHLRDNIFAVEGDLGTITHAHGHTIDCLAFPTSYNLRNPHVGVAARVHERAGPELDASLSLSRNVPSTRLRCDAFSTSGYRSGMNLLVHCVGPFYMSAFCESLLYGTYLKALQAIVENTSVTCAAFASISTGAMGFPVDRAAVTAFQAVRDVICRRHFTTKIVFVCFDKPALAAFTAARHQVLTSALNKNFVSNGPE
ncbi:hypothetical protein PybrP1_003500 [[Pythium] brassicae (nom. inval.)]|nr:hypothetical protein PybrP1_003500 [[Pythium] brassicae (nom. inval.)]